MAGNPDAASVWQEADVFVDFTNTAPDPTDTWSDWDAAWDLVGLLSGDDGFQESRDEDTDDKFAWGGIYIRTTHANHKRTIVFVALEDNATTFQLRNPGSERTNDGTLTTSKVKVPTYGKFKIGFETRDGDKIKRRWATASVNEVDDITENETDLVTYQITVNLHPDGDRVLYTEIEGPAAEPTGTTTTAAAPMMAATSSTGESSGSSSGGSSSKRKATAGASA